MLAFFCFVGLPVGKKCLVLLTSWDSSPTLGVAGARVCFPGGFTPSRHSCALSARPPACCPLLLPGRRVCVLERHPLRGPRLPGPRTARAATGSPCCRARAAHGSPAPGHRPSHSVRCAARPWSAGLLPSFTCLLLSSRLCPASLGCTFYFSHFLTALTTRVVLPCSFPATSARGGFVKAGLWGLSLL